MLLFTSKTSRSGMGNGERRQYCEYDVPVGPSETSRECVSEENLPKKIDAGRMRDNTRTNEQLGKSCARYVRRSNRKSRRTAYRLSCNKNCVQDFAEGMIERILREML